MATEITEIEISNKAAKNFRTTVFEQNQEEIRGKKSQCIDITLQILYSYC